MLQEGLAERDEQRRLKEEAAKRKAAEKEAEKRAWRERGDALRDKVQDWKERGEPRADNEETSEEKARRREKLVAKWTLTKEEVNKRQAADCRPPFAAVVPQGARGGGSGRSPTFDDDR